MAISMVLTPVGMILELVIVLMAAYLGIMAKKPYGFLFALTFLIFALYDLFASMGFSADVLSVINIIAILAALGGMYLLVREICPCCPTAKS